MMVRPDVGQFLGNIVGHDGVDRVVHRNDPEHRSGLVNDGNSQEIVLAIMDATSTAGVSGATVTRSVSMMRSMNAVGSASNSVRKETRREAGRSCRGRTNSR